MDSLSLPVLRELRTRKIISTPTKALDNWMKGKDTIPTGKDLMYFPWAIVEIKRGIEEPTDDSFLNRKKARAHEKWTQYCYRQAANASAAAVSLREQLIEQERDRSDVRDAQTMFSLTCVGSTAKLWITYRKQPVSLRPSSRSILA